jgi:hypothetical protein
VTLDTTIARSPSPSEADVRRCLTRVYSFLLSLKREAAEPGVAAGAVTPAGSPQAAQAMAFSEGRGD